MKLFEWPAPTREMDVFVKPAPEPSDLAKALAEKIKATQPRDWLFENEHCHYAPGGRRNGYQQTGLTLVYKPLALHLGPQDNMSRVNATALPGGDVDLNFIAGVIKGLKETWARQAKEAAEKALREEQERDRARAVKNAEKLLDQFKPDPVEAQQQGAYEAMRNRKYIGNINSAAVWRDSTSVGPGRSYW